MKRKRNKYINIYTSIFYAMTYLYSKKKKTENKKIHIFLIFKYHERMCIYIYIIIIINMKLLEICLKKGIVL